MKSKNPEYEETYMEKYIAARKNANIPDDDEEGLMKFMRDPIIS